MRDGPPHREVQGHGRLIVVVGVTTHQGAEESSAQGKGAEVSVAERHAGVRDAQRLACRSASRASGDQALESRVPGNGHALFGEGRTEKAWQQDLAGRLLYLFTRRGGTVFPAAYTVSPIIGEQGVTGVVVSFQDITARRQAQQGLESENRRLQQVVTNAPVAMAMLDTEMRYLAYSERWVTDYAIAAGEIAVGRSHYAVNPHIPEHWKANHRHALAGEALFNAEEPWLHPDGSRHYIRWAINPWYEAGGTVGGIIILTILVDGHDP